MLYRIVFNLHIVVSIITLMSGAISVVRSVVGWIRKKEYTRFDLGVSLTFTIALYIQLFLGFIVYFLLRTSFDHALSEIPVSSNDASLRFWAIEHIALMIFALFLTQLGRIFINRSTASLKRFKASLFYYGISLLLIFYSLSAALFFK